MSLLDKIRGCANQPTIPSCWDVLQQQSTTTDTLTATIVTTTTAVLFIPIPFS